MIDPWYLIPLVLAVGLAAGFWAGVRFQRRRAPEGWTFDDGEWFETSDKRVN